MKALYKQMMSTCWRNETATCSGNNHRLRQPLRNVTGESVSVNTLPRSSMTRFSQSTRPYDYTIIRLCLVLPQGSVSPHVHMITLLYDFASFFHDKVRSVHTSIWLHYYTTLPRSSTTRFSQSTRPYDYTIIGLCLVLPWQGSVSPHVHIHHYTTLPRSSMTRFGQSTRPYDYTIIRFCLVLPWQGSVSPHVHIHYYTTSRSGRRQRWTVGRLWPWTKRRSWSARHHAKPVNSTQLQHG